ncbi:MAG: DUF3810 family protein [Planctomycetota bacterium]
MVDQRGKVRRRAFLIAAVLVGVVAPLLPPGVVTSVYSRGLYPILQRVLVPITGSSGVLFSATLIVALAALLVLLVFRWGRRRGAGPSTRGVGSKLFGVLRLLWCVWLWFLLTWGLGYRQTPIEERWGLVETEAPEAGDLLGFAHSLTEILSVEPAHRDQGVAMAAVKRSLQRWIREHDGWTPAMPSRVKTLPTGVLSTSGFTGIVSPFLLEAHLDGVLSPTHRVAVGAHELAHLCGINGEADADVVAILAGLTADDPYARYCVALRTFGILGRDLGPVSWKLMFDRLPEFARADYLGRVRRLERQRSEAATAVVRTVYDGYLKSQGVGEGVADYGRAVELVLRARKRGLLPE